MEDSMARNHTHPGVGELWRATDEIFVGDVGYSAGRSPPRGRLTAGLDWPAVQGPADRWVEGLGLRELQAVGARQCNRVI